MHNFPKYKGGIASLTLVSFIPTITSEKRAIDGHFLSSVADDSKKICDFNAASFQPTESIPVAGVLKSPLRAC